ncbi:FecR family protein [Marinobacter pelagius]|uniref:FecR domain-containing protein n=1 Tax=Marinobacter sp. C7 TaxID=2951363 RepID=UPI001EF15A51|nr:FecR domain-containing protein [Marinobacter sp. C7]MCG7201529.1 FecR family protein [Marinobacter sp. C7]
MSNALLRRALMLPLAALLSVASTHTTADTSRVSYTAGSVALISSESERPAPLNQSSSLQPGDEIVSGAGTATIRLNNDTELRLFPGTRLQIVDLTANSGDSTVSPKVRLLEGKVHARARSTDWNPLPVYIETATAVALTQHATFTLQTSTEATFVRVTEGAVDFGAPGKAQRIPAGYLADVGSDGHTGVTIRQLPDAPDVASLPEVVTNLPVAVSWGGDEAPAYRLDIFETASGEWIGSREIKGNRFELQLLDNGGYRIEVAALDSTGLAGMPATVPLEVRLQAQAATLSYPAAGASANDDMPEFRWQLNGQNEIARVEVASDKSFRNLVATSEWAPETRALPTRPLEPGQYYWRVVTEAGGKSVVATEPRAITVYPNRIANPGKQGDVSGQQVTSLPDRGNRG